MGLRKWFTLQKGKVVGAIYLFVAAKAYVILCDTARILMQPRRCLLTESMTSSCLRSESREREPLKGRSFFRISRNPKCMSIVSRSFPLRTALTRAFTVQRSKPLTGTSMCGWCPIKWYSLLPVTVIERKEIEPGRSRRMEAAF